MAVRVGVVTIGQSPRVDVIPEIEKLVSGDMQMVEKGALDGLIPEEVKKLSPKGDDEVLITRMRDGTEVTVGRSFILPRLQEKISELDDEEVELITLLCAGEFSELRSGRPLLLPGKLLSGVLSSLVIEGKLGLMVPSQRQAHYLTKGFQELGFEVIGIGVSPYKDDIGAIAEAASQLKEAGADLIVMDCFGYNLEMKDRVREVTGKPVILVRSLLAGVIRELIA